MGALTIPLQAPPIAVQSPVETASRVGVVALVSAPACVKPRPRARPGLRLPVPPRLVEQEPLSKKAAGLPGQLVGPILRRAVVRRRPFVRQPTGTRQLVPLSRTVPVPAPAVPYATAAYPPSCVEYARPLPAAASSVSLVLRVLLVPLVAAPLRPQARVDTAAIPSVDVSLTAISPLAANPLVYRPIFYRGPLADPELKNFQFTSTQACPTGSAQARSARGGKVEAAPVGSNAGAG